MDNNPSSCFIPEELVYEMLLRLPAKSLCRFKRASKSFNALIDVQLKDKSHRKLLFEERVTYCDETTTFHVRDIDSSQEQKMTFENQNSRKLSLCSDYDSLFLLSDGFTNFVVCNPFTNQYITLPTCPVERTCGRCPMGLGYDPARDEYKVVLIDQWDVWIIKLGSNSWRRIEFFPFDGSYWSESACFAHGNLHWLYKPPSPFENVDFREQAIFAFDVAEEKFSLVVQPDYPVEGHITDLYVLDGCLCIGFLSHTTVQEVHLYVRNKYGDEYTWRNVCSIVFHKPLISLDVGYFNCVKIAGYSKEGNKILLDIGMDTGWHYERKYMVEYDLKKKSLNKIDVPAKYEFGRTFNESLVSVPEGVESTDAWEPFEEEFYDQTELWIFLSLILFNCVLFASSFCG